MKELMIKEELNGLEESKAMQIEAVFSPMVEMLKGFEKAYDAVVSMDVTKDTCKTAKRLRLDIAKIRISADKVRLEQKAEYTRGGNAVQGVYNILKFAVADKEEHLKDIETHFERLEDEKKKSLQAERELELTKFDVDGSPLNLCDMEDAVWENFLSGTRHNFQAVKDAEEKAEKERLEAIEAERIEQERIKKENAILKKEREDAEEKRKALEKENAEKLEKERAEYNRKAEIERKKREAEKLKQDAILKKEREEKEKLQREKEAHEAEEQRIEAERVKAEKKALEAGDPDKLKLLLSHFEELRGGKLKSEIAQKAVKEAYLILSTAIKSLK